MVGEKGAQAKALLVNLHEAAKKLEDEIASDRPLNEMDNLTEMRDLTRATHGEDNRDRRGFAGDVTGKRLGRRNRKAPHILGRRNRYR